MAALAHQDYPAGTSLHSSRVCLFSLLSSAQNSWASGPSQP